MVDNPCEQESDQDNRRRIFAPDSDIFEVWAVKDLPMRGHDELLNDHRIVDEDVWKEVERAQVWHHAEDTAIVESPHQDPRHRERLEIEQLWRVFGERIDERDGIHHPVLDRGVECERG